MLSVWAVRRPLAGCTRSGIDALSICMSNDVSRVRLPTSSWTTTISIDRTCVCGAAGGAVPKFMMGIAVLVLAAALSAAGYAGGKGGGGGHGGGGHGGGGQGGGGHGGGHGGGGHGGGHFHGGGHGGGHFGGGGRH